MNLLEFYNEILADAGLNVDENSYVINKHLNNEPTVLMDPNSKEYKRLALPTLSNTMNKTKENLLMFSLLPESITKGPSIILEYIKGKYNLKFNLIVNALFTYILKIANSPDTHTDLSPEERDLMLKIKDTDEKTIDLFKSISKKILEDLSATNSFVHLYIKKGGITLYDNNNQEQKYMRGCVVTFPFYKELLNDSDAIFGKKCRKKDKQIFKNLFEEMFINLHIENKYSKGSNCDVSPMFESLLKTTLNLYGSLDSIISLFNESFINIFNENFYDESINFVFKCKWEECIGKFISFEKQYREIPVQKESLTESSNQVSNNVIASPPVNNLQPVVQNYIQPYQQPFNNGPRVVSPEEMARLLSSQNNHQQQTNGYYNVPQVQVPLQQIGFDNNQSFNNGFYNNQFNRGI